MTVDVPQSTTVATSLESNAVSIPVVPIPDGPIALPTHVSPTPAMIALNAVELQENIEGLFQTHHDRLQVNQEALLSELAKLRVQVSGLQQELDAANAKLQESILLQKETVELQQTALDRLALIQSRVQAVLTQTFELHEYPIPRHFIVLADVPLAMDSWAKTTYRLYFLCEHAGPDGTIVFHIARHEGYPISRPTEFFSQYGPYALRLLQGLKYGLSVAHIVIPMLSLVQIGDLPESLTTLLDKRVMTTLQILEDFEKLRNNVRHHQPLSASSDPPQLLEGALEKVDGVDLRRLMSFLEIKDPKRTLGNLFRTVNDQGHVRWSCLDHYSTYRQPTEREFEQEVAIYKGSYDRQLGTATVALDKSLAIESFVDVMVKTRGLVELNLSLRNFTHQDLKLLAVGLQKTNVTKLRLECYSYKGSVLDYRRIGARRYDSLLKMMNGGKIQSFHFCHIPDFLPRLSIIPKEMEHLKVLRLDGIKISDVQEESLTALLRACLCLTELWIEDTDLGTTGTLAVLKGIKRQAPRPSRLKALTLKNCGIQSNCAKQIAKSLVDMKYLKRLNLTGNYLRDDGVAEIVEVVAKPGRVLERLELRYTGCGRKTVLTLHLAVCLAASHRRNNSESTTPSVLSLAALNLSDSVNELDPEALMKLIEVLSHLDNLSEFSMPRTELLSDESVAEILFKLPFSRLTKLEMGDSAGGGGGDLAAKALHGIVQPDCQHRHEIVEADGEENAEVVNDISEAADSGDAGAVVVDRCQSCADDLCLQELELDLCKLTEPGAMTVLSLFAQPRFRQHLQVLNLQNSKLFHSKAKDLSESLVTPTAATETSCSDLTTDLMVATRKFFIASCCHLTTLNLENTGLGDSHASILAGVLKNKRLLWTTVEQLNIRSNQMTALGGLEILNAMATNQSVTQLAMESQSFASDLGPGLEKLLKQNTRLKRLSVSHVSLYHVAEGLSHNATLLGLDLHHASSRCRQKAASSLSETGDGQGASNEIADMDEMEGEEIVAFGDCLGINNKTLRRLWVKAAEVCDDDEAISFLSERLKLNHSIVDLEWEFLDNEELSTYGNDDDDAVGHHGDGGGPVKISPALTVASIPSLTSIPLGRSGSGHSGRGRGHDKVWKLQKYIERNWEEATKSKDWNGGQDMILAGVMAEIVQKMNARVQS